MPPVAEPGRTPAPRSPELTPRRAAVAGLVAFQLFALVITAIPPTTKLAEVGKTLVAPYMRIVGLNQSWPMFSPNPPSADTYLLAQIHYRDGQTSEWKFPIPADYGYYRRYTIERYRKWANDNVRPNTGRGIWADAARFVARTNNTRGVPPDTIKLLRYWAMISPIDSGPPKGPLPWQHSVFFVYPVKPADIR